MKGTYLARAEKKKSRMFPDPASGTGRSGCGARHFQGYGSLQEWHDEAVQASAGTAGTNHDRDDHESRQLRRRAPRSIGFFMIWK